MPLFKAKSNKLKAISKNNSKTYHLSLTSPTKPWQSGITYHWRRRRPGYAFIEIMLGMLIFGVIVVVLSTSSGSLFTRRRLDQQAIASKVASQQIEQIRNLNFDSISNRNLTVCPNPGSSAEVTDLINHANCQYSITTSLYPDSSNPNVKKVTVLVSWSNAQNQTNSLTMDTLIYKDAGTQSGSL